jgi:hypothetical protein
MARSKFIWAMSLLATVHVGEVWGKINVGPNFEYPIEGACVFLVSPLHCFAVQVSMSNYPKLLYPRAPARHTDTNVVLFPL